MKYLKTYKLFEGKSERRNIVRTVVRDIITVLKNDQEGEFNLPSHLNNEEDFYYFPELGTDFCVELNLTKSDNIKDFDLDGGHYPEDDMIEISIAYNSGKMPQLIYNLIGYLNEVIRHELDHLINPHIEDERIKNPEKYYTQPHEMAAQIAGFRRLAKIRKQNFEDVLREWFYKTRNRAKHKMCDRSIEKVIKKILTYKEDHESSKEI